MRAILDRRPNICDRERSVSPRAQRNWNPDDQKNDGNMGGHVGGNGTIVPDIPFCKATPPQYSKCATSLMSPQMAHVHPCTRYICAFSQLCCVFFCFVGGGVVVESEDALYIDAGLLQQLKPRARRDRRSAPARGQGSEERYQGERW